MQFKILFLNIHMTRENKILLSLLPYSKESFKLKMLKDNASYKEIIGAINKCRCENIYQRLNDIKKYNTVFIDEISYPCLLKDLRIPPMRLQSNCSFEKLSKYSVGVGSSNIFYEEEYKKYYDFLLSLLRNNINIITYGNI